MSGPSCRADTGKRQGIWPETGPQARLSQMWPQGPLHPARPSEPLIHHWVTLPRAGAAVLERPATTGAILLPVGWQGMSQFGTTFAFTHVSPQNKSNHQYIFHLVDIARLHS